MQHPSPNAFLSILHVVAPAPFGGLESVLRALAAGHARRGHDVRVAAVVSPRVETHPFVEALERDKVATHVIRVGDRGYRAERRSVRALCREMRPQVVHTHGFRPDVIDGPGARKEGAAIVSTCHGFIDSDWRGRVYQLLQRRALRRFDGVIAVSDAIATRLRAAGVPDGTIHVIPNGYAPASDALQREDARAQLGLADGPVIGWVGRLSSEKGPDVALDALARVKTPSAQLVFIGDGRELDALRRRASALGVADRVVWCGAIADARRFYRAFDLYLLSSRTEGTPIALFDAMAARVPIVATRVGGVPQVVDGSSALVVDNGDVEAMATAIDSVFADAVSARARAEAAQIRLGERFDVERWLTRHEVLYRSIISG